MAPYMRPDRALDGPRPRGQMAAKSDESRAGISDGFAHSWRVLIGNSAFVPTLS